MLTLTLKHRSNRHQLTRSLILLALFLLATILIIFFLFIRKTDAFTPNYNPSNLIDNPTLTDTSTMNAGQIQAFLSSEGSGLANLTDVEACDATIAPYYGHCGDTISAAQIIFDAANAYDINPRAILATLEKEQSLVTDPTPSSSQVDCAMGYNSCSGYVGFFTQVDNGAWALAYNYQGSLGTASWLSWSPGANFPCRNATSLYSAGLYAGNTVTFANPGGTPENVTLANAATASLYCYTPYVGPYNVTGYSGSYNFVYYYQLWFGSTTVSTAYAWQFESQGLYTNSGLTQGYSGTPTVSPGTQFYGTVTIRNVGYQTWNQSSMHMGTTDPTDRTSPFYNNTWFNNNRPATMTQTTVVPGQEATFNFSLTAPSTTGSYVETYGFVADSISWVSGPTIIFNINDVSPVAATYSNNTLASGSTLAPNHFIISPDGESVLRMQSDGNLVLYSDFAPTWSSGTFGKTPTQLIMQTDGNLVIYFSDGSNWSTDTFGNSGATLTLQSDGNLVLYSSSNSPLWSTGTLHIPSHLDFVDTSLSSLNGQETMFPGQQLETANRNYRLILQSDGNLVLYDSMNRVLWSSGTFGLPVAYLAIQSDGNLVMYNANNQPLWNTVTFGHGPSQLIMQADGNLVLYTASGGVTWSSGTFNQP